MRFTSVLSLAVFGAAVALGCSSSNNSGGGGGSGGSGGACTTTINGTVEGCFSYDNLPQADIDAVCPTSSSAGGATYATVSSCPTANAVGTCTYKVTEGSTTYSYSETYYGGSTGLTCSSVQTACNSGTVSGSITTSFQGDGC